MIEYRKSLTLRSALLKGRDVELLIDLVNRDFPDIAQGDKVKISCVTGTAAIEESTFSALLTQISDKTNLKDFRIDAIGWNSDRKIDRSARVSFLSSFVLVSVSGLNESWVLGFTEKLEAFFKSRRSPFRFFNTPVGYALAGAFYAIQFGAGIYVAYTSWGSLFFNVPKTNQYILWFFFLSIALTYLESKLVFVDVSLNERKTFREKFEMPLFLVFGVATLVQAAVALIEFLKGR